MEIGASLFDRFIGGSGIAPAKPGTVIGTNSCLLRDAGLHYGPINRVSITARLEYDRGAPASAAIKMKLATTDIDQATWRPMGSFLHLGVQMRDSNTPDD
jgi:hypothetical protein